MNITTNLNIQIMQNFTNDPLHEFVNLFIAVRAYSLVDNEVFVLMLWIYVFNVELKMIEVGFYLRLEMSEG